MCGKNPLPKVVFSLTYTFIFIYCFSPPNIIITYIFFEKLHHHALGRQKQENLLSVRKT